MGLTNLSPWALPGLGEEAPSHDLASLQLLRCASGEHLHELEIRPARRRADREAVFRLRHAAYCGQGKDLPARQDCQERDAYDDAAVLLMASIDGNPVGTLRVLFPLENGLLMETLGFSLADWMPRHATAEVSRLVIDKHALPSCIYSPTVTSALFHRALIESRRRGQRFWVFDTTPPVLRIFQRLGWSLTSLGDPRVHHGRQFEAYWMALEDL